MMRPRHCATAFGRGRHGGAGTFGWAGCRPHRGGRAGATGSARGAPQVVALLGVLALASASAAAESLETDSRIVSVTVFADRASVTRAATLKLSKGAHEVRLAHLPSRIEPDSVTARGSGEAKVTLFGVRLVTAQLATAQDPKVSAIEEEIRTTMRQQSQLHNTKRVLEQERKYLDSIQAASSEQIGKDLVTKSPSAADADALLKFLDQALLANMERDQKADIELEASARQLDKLHRQLAELTQGRAQQEAEIVIDLEAQEPGAFQLEASYRVPGATWQPSYEARATTGATEVDLGFSGLVRQQTGEDWTNAQLTLSTAKPAIAGSMPEIQPWFLRPWEPQPIVPLTAGRAKLRKEVLQSAVSDEGSEEKAFYMDTTGGAPPREAELAQATVATQGPAVTFALPKPVSIPADWQPHKVPIGSQRFKADFAYETTPRLLPLAFLRAKVMNASETFYLTGSVSVFLDGAFVATASLKQVAPNEAFDLYFGIDERVKVERKPLKERVEVSLIPGLRGKTKSTDYEFLTTIENFTGRRITMTVFDQTPVSEREEIVIESVRQVPGDVEKDKEKPGVFHWKLELEPHQKQELRLSYRLRHPVDMQVQ